MTSLSNLFGSSFRQTRRCIVFFYCSSSKQQWQLKYWCCSKSTGTNTTIYDSNEVQLKPASQEPVVQSRRVLCMYCIIMYLTGGEWTKFTAEAEYSSCIKGLETQLHVWSSLKNVPVGRLHPIFRQQRSKRFCLLQHVAKAWSVRLCACMLSVILVHPAKPVDGMRCHLTVTRVVPPNTVLEQGSWSPWKGEIWESEPPVCSYVMYCQITCINYFKQVKLK